MWWCQGVPQASNPWRARVAGASSRSWRWAVGHRTPEGWRSLSFLRPPLGRSRLAPVVAMRPPRLAVWLCCSWDREPRSARVRSVGRSVPVSGTGVIAPRSRGCVWGGLSPPPLAQALGRPRAPLAACLWRVVSPAAGRPPTLGGRRRMSWMLRLQPGGGPCEALPVARARLAGQWWGCAPVRFRASWIGIGDRW